jgi:hypothetical protein
MTGESAAGTVKNELAKTVLAGLRSPWTVLSAVLVRRFP